MRLSTFLLLALLAVSPALAQQPTGAPAGRPGMTPGAMAGGTIRGRVTEASTGEALEAATVSLWRLPDSTLVTGLLTDENGAFVFENLRPGRFYASISYIGYAARRINVELTAAALTRDLGEVKMQEGGEQLAEVQVETDRAAVAVEVDRMSYNVANDPTSSGGTAEDVLQKVPSVEVDSDGNVSLRGSDAVAILINGRPAPVPRQFLAAFLRQIPADQIERIEVIPNPSARYDPDGLAGMLNIVLKTATQTQRTVSGGVQAGGGTNGGFNGSANVNVSQNKIAAYASYGLRRDRRLFEGDTYRENRYGSPLTFLTQDDDGEFGGLNHVLNGTLDYSLSRQQTLTLRGVLSSRNGDRDSQTGYVTRSGTADGAVTSRYARITDGTNDGLNTDLTATYRNIKSASRDELTAEVRFGFNRDRDASSILQQPLDPATGAPTTGSFTDTSDGANDRRDLTAQVDLVRPLFGAAGKLEAGYKGTLRRLDSDQDASRFIGGVQTPSTDHFVFDENVQAAYLTLGRKFGKFSTQAGVRAEQVWTDFSSQGGAANPNNYFSLYPSAFVTYSPTIQNTFTASYSRRVDRADPRQLNPVARIDDPLTRQEGNPNLQPSYTNSFNFAYTRFSNIGSLTLSPFYRYTNDAVSRVTTVDPLNPAVTVATFANIAKQQNMGAELNANVRRGQQFALGVSSSLYRQVSDGVIGGQSVGVDAVSYNVRGNFQWTPRTGSTLSGFAFVAPPRKTEQGRFGGFSRTELSFRQQFMQQKASLTLRVSDPFKTSRFTSTNEGPGYYFTFERRPQERQLQLTFQYLFGQQPRNRQQQRPQEQQPQQQDSGDPFGQSAR